MRRALSALLAAASLPGCSHDSPLAGQVLVYVDTDALLPPAVGQPVTHSVLFDSLAIDVFMPGEDQPCTGCSRQFPLDEGTVNAGNASFGIPMQPHVSGYRARVRLYHTTVPGAGPRPDTTLESVVALPPVDDTGEVPIVVFLATDSLANPSGTLDAPAPAVLGSITTGHAGTWPGGAPVPCSGAPQGDEVCVPGGAFWMGNPDASFAGGLGAQTDVERLVVVSPFFIDAYETTVGELRPYGTAGVAPWTGSVAGTDPRDWCSFSNSPSRDGMPLNCITWQGASAYCAARGSGLPTEAELEYVAGGLSSSLYVWGADDPTCDDAVFGRTGYGVSWGSGDQECRAPLDFGGPLEPHRDHSSSRDVLLVGGQALYDLAGNVGEWAMDSYEAQGGDCWPEGVLHDPVCLTGTTRVERGGSWVTPAENLRAAARVPRGTGPGVPDIGVRCARKDGG